MKIVKMNIVPIAVADPPLLNAAGLHAPFALRIVLELVTDEGLSGWSEVPGSEKTKKALLQAEKYIIGKDPFQLNRIFSKLKALTRNEVEEVTYRRQQVHVKSAVEVACFDLMGKAADRPVVDLLGGRSRDKVPFSAYLFYKHEGAGGKLGFKKNTNLKGWFGTRQNPALEPKGIVEQARSMIEHYGFKSIKLKGGVFEPALEVETIFWLRERFVDLPIRFDPNGVWSVDTAIHWGRKMEEIMEYYEDPVHGQKNMGKIGKAVKAPIATNMCTTSFDDLPGSLQFDSEQIILSDHHYWGGFRASLELARFCKTFDRGLSMHSNSHLGISLAAMVHIAAAIPNLDYACDTHYPWQEGSDIVVSPLIFEDGSIRVPDEPGLGVEVDRDKLLKLHEQYISCGLTKRNDELEMQKIQPGWKYKKTRW
jgi:glucarate dehydratase